MFLKKINEILLDESNFVDSNFTYIRIYRWNPYLRSNPWFNIFPLRLNKKFSLMILDILFIIKNKYDSTLAFRRSCREGICGSCAMNINGLNSLACLKKVFIDNHKFITIYPLPHMLIIKDLICDFTNFYNQYRLIKPWLITKNVGLETKKENLQSKIDRFELDGLYECVLCACCSSSCPSYWWNYSQYLGPAILLQAYRWISDSRDNSKIKRINFLNNNIRVSKCHSITNCTKICPKKLNPAKIVNFLKYINYI